MRPLVIGEMTRTKIKELVSYARANPFSMEDLLKIAAGKMKPPGDQNQFCVNVDYGYRCVFSFELQGGRLIRHLSISVDAADMYPSVQSVQIICAEFGFLGNIAADSIVYADQETQSINVMQQVGGFKI